MSKLFVPTLIFLSALSISTPAYAYLDPGTGSMILQGLIAAVAGAAVALRLYWHRLSSIFSRKKTPSGDAAPKDGEK